MIKNKSEGKVQSSFDCMTSLIVDFIRERDWEQFHKSKDTALALFIEASELNEAFLWKDDADVSVDKVKEELADVFIYALDLARQYDFDIEEIIEAKIKKNAQKYPIEKCKGSSKKYTEL